MKDDDEKLPADPSMSEMESVPMNAPKAIMHRVWFVRSRRILCVIFQAYVNVLFRRSFAPK